ncbi:MAG TPA: oligopeptide ABC transporter permease [Candidatus Eremiobacteraceae bacterium]|nr:oligopeptide ABC transporter permease [Candidatus Eremiobacteraceae bacterium]
MAVQTGQIAPNLAHIAVAVQDDDYARERHLTWRKFKRHRLAVAGAVVLLIIIIGAVFAPAFTRFDPAAIDNVWQGTPLAPGVAGHWLGTDEVGRDLWARLLFGGRISLTIGLFAVIIEVLLGSFIGAIAGYFGGWVDGVLMRITDAFLCIPLLPLLLVLTAIVAAESTKAALNFGSIVLIIGFLSWMPVARLVRGAFLSLREKEFCEAARAIGSSHFRIMFRHLLPNAMAPIVVQATLDVANVIILESVLSFLGFGIQPPTASWGSMLANAQENISIAWWAAVYPGLCIFATVLAINYMGDGLRDALDPNVR